MNQTRVTYNPEELLSKRRSVGQGQYEAVKIWILRGLVLGGFGALFYYFSWWFVDGRLSSPWLALLFLCAVVYSGVQLAGNWIVYLMARRPAEPLPPPSVLTVDVFVTACGEDYSLIKRSLAAAVAMRGEHNTWLLDDGGDQVLADLAERLGAGYLKRADRKDAKAGNLNAALPRTQGDIIAIFDVDHVPAPDFLERSLGHFRDPRVGFVQVMLTFANSQESWVAQSAMETSLEFYNPTSLGTDLIGGATMMGSNALIRREALERIGGYRPGLAEDLATSIALHADGWRSAYVAEPLAPGLAPPSFTAWFVQQLKWARGVFELLLTVYLRVFFRLTWGQRLSYAVRMTKYWIGPAVGLHLFATIAVLTFSAAPFRMAFHDYLFQITPLAIFDALIRFMALTTWRHPSTPRTSLLRAVVLVYATWPIYLVAWLMALFRLPLGFRPTPKSKDGKLNPVWLLPQVTALALLVVGTLYTVLVGGHRPSVLLVFAILQGALQLILLKQWLSTEVEVAERISRSLVTLRKIARPVGINRRMMKNQVRAYLCNLHTALNGLPVDLLEQSVSLLHQARLSNRRVFILGNGGSAWIADRLAYGLAGHTPGSRWPAFRVFRVLDTPDLVRVGIGVEQIVFDEYNRLVGSGDVVVAVVPGIWPKSLAGSLLRARSMQARTIFLSGPDQGRPDLTVDIRLQIRGECKGEVEDQLLLAVRVMCKALHEANSGQGPAKETASIPAHAEPLLAGGAHLEPSTISELTGFANLSGGSLSPGFLYELGRSAETGIDREALLGRVLQVCLDSIGANSGSLLLFDQHGRVDQAALVYAGQVEFYPAGSLTDTLEKGLAGWVVANRQPALVTNTNQDTRWLRRPWDEINGSRSAVSVPLLAGERVAGVLTLVHPQPDRFTQGDVVSLMAIAVGLMLFGTTDQ